MALWCTGSPEFETNERVVSLVYRRLPEIEPGTKGRVVSVQVGSLYAVQLPCGELHQWFARFELEPLDPGQWGVLKPGTAAKITSAEGRPPHIMAGMAVQIVHSVGMVPFYDVMIDGLGYYRWLAETELAPAYAVSDVCHS